MGWRGTAILALLTLMVGAYLWFEERPAEEAGRPPTLLGEPESADPNKPIRHLLDFKPADVIGVRLEHGGQTREAQRADAAWRDVTPPGAIDDFVHNLAELGVLMDIPAGPADLKDYGLQPPQSVLHLRLGGDAPPLVLQIGDRNPAVTGVYVRLGDDGPVLLAGALAAWEFDKAFRALGGAAAGS